jgi:hypothetical protein
VTEPAARRPVLPAVAFPVLVVAVLLLLGGVLAVLGAFLVPTGPRVGGHVLSLGAAIGVVGNVAGARLSLRALPTLGPVAMLVGWTVVAVVLSARRSNGSVVLPGSGDLAVPGLVFLFGGVVAGLAATFVRVRR